MKLKIPGYILAVLVMVCNVCYSEEDDFDRLARITGYSKDYITKSGASIDAFIRAYAVYLCTGNSISDVLRASDNGKDMEKFYKRNSITGDVKAIINNKYGEISSLVVKQKMTLSDYTGIDKNKVAGKISELTGISSSDVLYYGFKSGFSLSDILLSATIASSTGNNIGNVIETRKNSINWAEVYRKYNIITDNFSAFSQKSSKARKDFDTYIGEMKKTGGGSASPGEELPDETKIIIRVIHFNLGIPIGKITELFKQGEARDDVVKGCSIAWKTKVDLFKVMQAKIENETWDKTIESYKLSEVNKKAVDDKIEELNKAIAKKLEIEEAKKPKKRPDNSSKNKEKKEEVNTGEKKDENKTEDKKEETK